MSTLFQEALNETFSVSKNGKIQKMTIREGIVRTAVREALKGNFKAMQFVYGMEPKTPRVQRSIRKITSDMTQEEAAAAYAETLKLFNSRDDD